MPIETLIPFDDYMMPPQRSARDPRLEHEYRRRTPGYPEYASEVRDFLFPTEADLLSYVPGLDTPADWALTADAIRDKRYEDAAWNGAAMLVPGLGAGIIRAARSPERAVSAYRALRIYPDDPRFPGVYPAMLGKDKLSLRQDQRIPMEEWLQSEFKPFGMAPRKGYHAGLLPRAAQFDLKRPELKGMMPQDMVWSDVSMGADLDLSDYLDPNKPTTIYQRQHVPFEDPSALPEGGMYLYSNRKGDPPWIISDYARHNRILTDEEVEDILRSAGQPAPPPRHGGAWTEARLRDYGLIQPAPPSTEYLWMPQGQKQVEVVRNPTPEDYGRIASEVRKEYPDLMPGEPKTRFTIDEDGNRYIWKAYEAVHGSMEPMLEARLGRKVSQHFSPSR